MHFHLIWNEIIGKSSNSEIFMFMEECCISMDALSVDDIILNFKSWFLWWAMSRPLLIIIIIILEFSGFSVYFLICIYFKYNLLMPAVRTLCLIHWASIQTNFQN